MRQPDTRRPNKIDMSCAARMTLEECAAAYAKGRELHAKTVIALSPLARVGKTLPAAR
ncbi:hypothetical protein QQY66_03995 [Streptomyces sp. DG2A-72]|uniref:hypothetical protein n=1 Tax=Streptomyces sp. DG2A-72 TaxID=3051386 RepID=UPI00265C40CE|nr:hypothetical protein [Streptomyces sp. DG2A-72]MDO0930875.1 hypothetical protein [Streptomyces sp. DG2A-72]